jgi:two-component system, cell cycle response regulator DivK
MPKTIMIVEDDSLNMKLFNDLLTVRGLNTIEQYEGLSAYDAIREHLPDLVLMDIQLPGRSGLDIIKELKSSSGLKHIPVIAVTAFAQKEDERFCRDRGCDGYLSKPISIQTFYDTIAEFVDITKPGKKIVH